MEAAVEEAMCVLRAVFCSGQASRFKAEGVQPFECRKKRKQEAQGRWLAKNEGYFKGRYDEVKEWRRRKKEACAGKMIQDKIPPSSQCGSMFY